MPLPLSHLDATTRDQVLSDLNYLNTTELRRFCRRHGIAWKIYVLLPDGSRRVTKDTDRKAIVLKRVRTFLTSGIVEGPTVYPASVLNENPLPTEPGPEERLYYGRYDKRNVELLASLRRLTDDRFRDGAIARILLNEFWTDGQAPTLAEFSSAWSEASDRGLGVDRGEHPEAAYLTDLSAGRAGGDWKTKRTTIAKRVLAILDQV